MTLALAFNIMALSLLGVALIVRLIEYARRGTLADTIWLLAIAIFIGLNVIAVISR